MSYEEKGRIVHQQGKNGAAYVTVLDSNGNIIGQTDLTTITALLGNISGNPTSNTVLARLKDITDRLSAPKYTTVSITQVATNATGSTFNAFPSVSCEFMDIVNDTGTDLEYRRGGAGNTMVILAGQTRTIQGLSNANAISIRRKDVANTPVTVRAEAFKL